MSGIAGGVAPAQTLVLPVEPDWPAVQAAWEPCHAMLASAGLGDDQAYQLAMVAQELLENAVKYGAHGVSERIELSLCVAPDEVTVEVRNHVGVDEEHLRRFDHAVQWIRGYQDPFEAYVERLKHVSSRPYAPGESGLGLTRIAYEGRCAIDFYVDEGNVLSVSAVYRRNGAEA